jgi:hypothetical protein
MKTRNRPYEPEHLAALSARAHLHRESYRTQKPSDIREAVPAADHYEVVQRFLDTLQQTRTTTLNEVVAVLDKEWTAARGRYESSPTVEREAYCIAARDLLLTVRALHTKT